MKIVLATRNAHKLREFSQILEGSGVELVSMEQFPDCPEVVEDGTTFAENALKKARAVCAHTGLTAAADDSGLEVEALGGRPGIYSARYAGPDADDARNIARLLADLEGVPAAARRGARFCCVIALVSPGGAARVVTGTCPGRILGSPRGAGGFGYDPVFLDEASGLSFAEMPAEQKNRISHRRRAAMNLKDLLPEFLQHP